MQNAFLPFPQMLSKVHSMLPVEYTPSQRYFQPEVLLAKVAPLKVREADLILTASTLYFGRFP